MLLSPRFDGHDNVARIGACIAWSCFAEGLETISVTQPYLRLSIPWVEVFTSSVLGRKAYISDYVGLLKQWLGSMARAKAEVQSRMNHPDVYARGTSNRAMGIFPFSTWDWRSNVSN